MCVVLPATPGYGIALAHQEAIARLQGLVWRHIRGTVDIAQDRTAPTVQDVEEQTVMTTARLHRPEDTDICRKAHQATGVSGGQR